MSRWFALVSILALGCGPAISTDDDAGVDSTQDDTAGTTAGTVDTTATNSTGTTATTTTGTTGMMTTATTVEPPGCASDFVTGCQSSCAAYITCNPEQGPYEDCVTACIDSLAEQSAECQQLYCEAYSCYGTLDCPSLENGTPECNAILDKAIESCGGGEEKCFVGAGPDGTCEYGCEGLVTRRMQCDSVQCTCFENDAQTAVCAVGNICDSLDALEEYAGACCGW